MAAEDNTSSKSKIDIAAQKFVLLNVKTYLKLSEVVSQNIMKHTHTHAD